MRRYAAGNDKTAPNELLWPEGGNSWRAGGPSPTNAAITSFDFVDEIVKKLANNGQPIEYGQELFVVRPKK